MVSSFQKCQLGPIFINLRQKKLIRKWVRFWSFLGLSPIFHKKVSKSINCFEYVLYMNFECRLGQ